MGIAITIRNVPEHVRDELAARAAKSGRSLQEYLLMELQELAMRPTMEQVIARARARVRASGSKVTTEGILADLREDRER
jgi:plasmid stability protein